jgi:adenylate kinase
MQKQYSFILMGSSGSGKGTQAEMLIKTFGAIAPDMPILHIETGKELRKMAKSGSHSGKVTAEVIDHGKIMPVFLTIYNWTKVLVDNFTGKETLIFDGTPRRLVEAQAISSVFPFYGLDKPWVIYLDVHEEELFRRLLARGRNDDTHESITSRLAWYKTDVVPAIEYFRSNPEFRFLDIDGRGTIEQVHADIVKKIGLE